MALVSKALSTAGKAVGKIAQTNAGKIAFGALNVGLSTSQSINVYKESREEGDSKAVSLLKGVGDFAFWGLLGNYALPWIVVSVGAKALPTITTAGGKIQEQYANTVYKSAGKLGSGYFDMSQAGYTMRQRSINAIKNNGLNVNSVLGNEARTYYRSI